MRFLIATLALSIAAPAVAASSAPMSEFEHDGSRYEYTRTEAANGVIVINGRSLNDGSDFALRVSGAHVTGTMGGGSVDFNLSKAELVALASDTPALLASK